MNKTQPIILLVLFIPIFLLSGCATFLSKSNYQVSITSKPSDASITITNKKGEIIHKGNTPANVKLKASSGFFQSAEYTVKFSKPGFKPFQANIIGDIDGWYLFGNILIGGLIGWLIVDPATGAMWKLEDISAILLEDEIAQNTNSPQLNIALIEDVPENFRSFLKQIN